MLPPVGFLGLLMSFVTLASSAFIKYPIAAVNGDSIPASSKWYKRQNAVPVANGKTGTLYTIQLSVGTPPQPVVVVIDTGSSDLWVNPTCTAAPNQVEFCNSFPHFDPTKSSTLNDTGSSFRLNYGKGSAFVEYFTDVVTLGSVALEDQIFGINTGSNDIPLGILGLAPFLGGRVPRYSYVLDTMVSQMEINSRAFSLDLRSIDSPDGSIIFGGIDTKKYIGSLEKRAIIPAASTPSDTDRYWIYLTSVCVTSPAGSSETLYTDTTPGLPVFLDSGGTLTRLPTTIYQAIGESFIADFPDTFLDTPTGYYVVDCSIASSSGSVDFGFGSTTIRVAYKDVIWDLGQPDLDICVVGVLPEDDEPVLGDSFLRAAYVVYDQDNRNLHLAQAANCGTELMAIGRGPDAVPSVTGGCGTVFTSSTLTSSTKPTTSTAPGSEINTSELPTTTSKSIPSFSSPSFSGTTPATIPSTLTSTTIYTITSCPPTVTNCPYGQITTEAVTVATSYSTSEKPASTINISAPCLNCDVPSSAPSITGTGSYIPTGSSVTTGPSTSKPSAVVTAGAERGPSIGWIPFVGLGVAGMAVMF